MHHSVAAGAWKDVETLTFLPSSYQKRSSHSQKPWSCQSMNDECWRLFVFFCLCVNVSIYVLFTLLVSFWLNFQTTGPRLLCDSVTSLPSSLVITCSGPPLPAAGDDLGKEVEIKCGSEVSLFSKTASTLPAAISPTLLSQWALKLTAKTRQISWWVCSHFFFFINFKQLLW